MRVPVWSVTMRETRHGQKTGENNDGSFKHTRIPSLLDYLNYGRKLRLVLDGLSNEILLVATHLVVRVHLVEQRRPYVYLLYDGLCLVPRLSAVPAGVLHKLRYGLGYERTDAVYRYELQQYILQHRFIPFNFIYNVYNQKRI